MFEMKAQSLRKMLRTFLTVTMLLNSHAKVAT
jgi:hypothetical protein